MDIKSLALEGIFEITSDRITDERGYFMETYNRSMLARHGLQTAWVQENQSYTSRLHTVRGLHFQSPPFVQTKLVRVVKGEILDVFVDLRKESATFGQWDSIVLSERNCKSVYISGGFAHGFCTLTENVIVQYKVDNIYAPKHEGGIRWNDDDINIDWKVADAFLSEKDGNLPFFKNFFSPF